MSDLKIAYLDATLNARSLDVETTSKVNKILDKLLYGLISVTTYLCFFSLSASVSANLYEKKKELSVIRATGFTKYRVRGALFI